MSAVARTPLRAIRVPDEIWDAAMARARNEGTTVSAIVVETLRHYAGLPFKVDPASRAAIEADLDLERPPAPW